MPVVRNKKYRPPAFLYNGFLQTVVPVLIKRQSMPLYERERLELPDGDFVDLDWMRHGNERLIVLTHGLEGSSQSSYVVSAVHALGENRFDLLAWNCRSCSGQLNRNKCLYHHGEIGDIEHVLRRASEDYGRIGLLGYSMGGNILLKWMGLRHSDSGLPVEAAVAVSTPCDLEGASKTLDRMKNRAYRLYFTRQLRRKLRAKAMQFPDWIDMSGFGRAREWRDIDEAFSAPVNGLSSADEFYRQGSSRNFLQDIAVPTLILNAQNDPVLSEGCHPAQIAEAHEYIHLEITEQGGHVGFPMNYRLDSYADLRTVAFFGEHMGL